MNGNSSLMDGTFFADQSFNVKESLKSKEEFTKNSSNPEKIITE